jgi:ABC-type transporter Mla MlaB component
LFDKLFLLSPTLEFPNLKCMGMNKLYVLSGLIDHEKFLEIAQEIEKKTGCLTVEGITELVEKVHSADSEALMATLELPTDLEVPLARPQVRLNSVPEKISKMMKELNTLLPQFETGVLTQQKFASPETASVLEKISVNLRRLLFYLRKLEKTRKPPRNAGVC